MRIHLKTAGFIGLLAGLLLSLPVMLSAGLTLAPRTVSATDSGYSLLTTGQYRPRLIVDSGRDLKQSDVLEREYMSQRSRLTFDIKSDAAAPSLRIMFQDVRIWGEESSPVNQKFAAGLDVHEAYALIPVPAVSGLSAKLGRQEMIYDNHRLIGNIGWLQRAQTFDAARFDFKRDQLTLSAFWAQVQERDSHDPEGTVPPGRTGDHKLMGVHANYKFAGAAAEGQNAVNSGSLSLAWFGRDNQATKEQRHTLGGIFVGKMGGLSGTVEGYVQTGEIPDPTASDPTKPLALSAQMAALNVGYALDITGKPTIALFGEYLSGNGKTTGVFDTLYATNHKFYGEMDFFLSIPGHTGRLGLMDVGGALSGKPHSDLALKVTYHMFQTATADALDNKDLGTELDAKLMYNLRKGLDLRVLWGVFMPGKAIGALKGFAADAKLATEHFGYLTLDAKF